MTEAAEGISILFDDSVEKGAYDEDRLRRLSASVLEGESVVWSCIGVILAGHETVRALNREYLDHDFDTDVLSFLIDRADDGIEAEIYVDVQTAEERHHCYGATPGREIERYVVHGLLHLAGYEDDTPEDKRRMRELEDRYLDEPISPVKAT